MGDNTFSERVNSLSQIVSTMTADPAERLGIANALCEIYRYELQKSLVPVPMKRSTNNGDDNAGETTNTVPSANDQSTPNVSESASGSGQ